MKYAIALLVVLAVATMASAAPSLTWTATDLGGGLTAYDFALQGMPGGAAYANVSFWSTGINQIKFMGTMDVNDEAFAAALGADKPKDSWAYAPFGTGPGPGYLYTNYVKGAAMSGFAGDATSWTISLGSGAGSNIVNGALLAHIVSTGGVPHWNGIVSTTGDFVVNDIPEPATMCLLGMGVVGLLRRRR